MQSIFCLRRLLVVGISCLTMAVMTDVVVAEPRPGAKKPGFRLFARSLGALTINRIVCGLTSTGQICTDSTGTATIPGAFWPRGSADGYVFNSGLQIAGLVGADGGSWAGDTTGAFFFDPKGTTIHGDEVEPIYNTSNPDDAAFIGDTTSSCNDVCRAAKVPSGDVNQDLFFPLLRGRASASQGDVWWLSWDGNPALNTRRPHPLGVLVEQRGMGWNFPSGNEDILYFIYTFYNVTSRDPAVYASVRPGMREILARQGAAFQDDNEAAFGVEIPDGGYTIENLFAAFSADPDVANFRLNFSTVNVPFALGYVYDASFQPATGWTFDASVFSPPFFPGSGFFGVKYLKSPEIEGAEVGLSLFSNTINQGAFDDAQDIVQLFRYLSNNINPAAGDAPCNTGDPQLTKICFVNNAAPADMRFFQSSGPLTLAPGEFGTIAVAYIFAAPVVAAGCNGPGSCGVLAPGDPRRLSALATVDNANRVDSVAGFTGYSGDADADGLPDQGEFAAPVAGSLLGKALVAQSVFDNGFLLPFAPESPNFFLIPGDNQVSVIWQPSPTETIGDPFFSIASSPTRANPDDPTLIEPNPLFDPNYRQFDVEGYRIYRGRVSSPDELTLVAQFDYAGTFIADFQGQVNPLPGCAPELGVDTACAVPFDSLVAGTAPTVADSIPLVGPIVQVKRGERTRLATGEALVLVADTALTGSASNNAPALSDNGVSFLFVDHGVRSNIRYFYSVTAFDVNSYQSGPSALESPRNTKPVTPAVPAGNLESSVTLTQSAEGRGVNVTQGAAPPTIDPATGRFSGKQPPADNIEVGFAGELAQVIFAGQGTFSGTLLGLGLGDARNTIPISYTYETSSTAGVLDTVTVSIVQPLDATNPEALSAPFPAATADPALSERFGVPPGFVQQGQLTQGIVAYQQHTAFGRGCHIDHLFGDEANCTYNGPRWFSGPNETKADPNSGNVAGTEDATDNNNAGELPGVLTVHNPQSYHQISGGYRTVEAILAGAVRAADFNVYWGTGGVVDSVVDLTHNVPVPFMADSMGGGWGFLNQANTSAALSGDATTDLTLGDYGCVFPLNDVERHPDQLFACPAGVVYALSNTAVPGPVQIGADVAARPNPGFSMYLAGHIFFFELAPASSVPAAGTVWTMRSYIGVVQGGNGAGGALGPYSFTAAPRTFNALGTKANVTYDASNAVVAATAGDLEQVHTVPDPYYVTSQFEQATETKILKFVNLPADAIIRIYSSSGVLVHLLEHRSSTWGGSEDWNLRNRNNQVVASGVYFYHIEAGDARRVGRFTVVNFAQ